MKLFLDLETYNEHDLKAVGTPVYAETAEILLFAYAIDDQPVQVWDRTANPSMPSDLKEAIDNCDMMADVLIAHHSFFDRSVLTAQMTEHDWRIPRWDDTMVQAQVHALPGALDELCVLFGLPAEMSKLADGKKLVQLFCKPQPANRKVRRATKDTHPAEWARFIQYAANDVEAMRELHNNRLPKWNWKDDTRAEWHLDQRINDKGFAIDVELVTAGAKAAVKEKDILARRFAELSGGLKPTQRAKVQEHLNATYGLTLTGTSAEQLLPIIEQHSSAILVEMCEIILSANRSSTAKYKKLKPAISSDGRYRGGLQFSGAGRTRRWAGRGLQAQNLPSRGLPPAGEIEAYIAALKDDCHDLLFDNLMLYGSASLRGAIIAPAGKKLVVADLANIEGRMLSWISGEEWKLEAFRAYDAGTGPDLYNVTAASILGGSPYDISKTNRNIFGKVPDLASGYQGGVAGYQTFAAAYHVKMADYWDTIEANLGDFIGKANANYDKWGAKQAQEQLLISKEEWIASETCKLAWRARHPATVQFWYDLGDAAKAAIQHKGTTFSVRDGLLKLKCVKHGNVSWLLIKLPSGRYLTYYGAKLTDDGSIAYMGRGTEDGKTTTAWVQLFTHGGKLTGNVCQSLARDVLAYNLPAIEQAGYDIELLVHDEVITECPDTEQYNVDALSRLLATNPPWSEGLPLAAAGFETYRYKKE